MKKLLFAAYDIKVGGIETALLTLLNYLAENKYDITLVLEKKQGIFLNELNKTIHIIEYCPSKCQNIIIRKLINLTKRIRFILKYSNKFDFSASFATYSLMNAFVARCASKNNSLWGHADYLELFNNDKNKFKDFFKKLKYNKFRHIVFVSKAARNSFISIYPEVEDKVIYCNNLIDYKKIINLSNEQIDRNKDKSVYTFVNIGRHDELQKKLTRIIKAAKLLKQDGMNFKVLFIGDGKDTHTYIDKVKEYNLENVIEFIGVKKNPYPYMKLSDTVILTSDYEGYPVVFLESFILEKPIITTDVSDALEQVDGIYGKVTKKEVDDIYVTMKDFIQNGYTVEQKFNAEEYNKEILLKLEKIF